MDGKDELAVFAPITGKYYGDHDDVRLMWVGRAVNDWTKVDLTEDEDTFVMKVFDGVNREDRYHFLRKPCSAKRPCQYYLTSEFWSTSKLVFEKLMPSIAMDKVWTEHLVWANLYAAAPCGGGNPSVSLRQVQRYVCQRMLIKQIEISKPTHIVFVTGWDGWFSDFSDLFERVQRIPGADHLQIPLDGRGYIGDSVAIVTKRPDKRNRCFTRETFVGAVCEALLSR